MVVDPTLDSDGDGLCDQTERLRGTDPFLADTDADGLPDRVELDFGYDPRRPSSPDRDALIFLAETEAASRQLPITHVVRGDGEDYSGAFEALAVSDRLDLDALDHYEDSLAVGAVPLENVVQVVPEEERFYGVFGETQLIFEVRLAFGGNIPRFCARAYPFRYVIKRSDGRLVYLGRFVLIVLPPGQRLDTAEWCTPVGGCI